MIFSQFSRDSGKEQKRIDSAIVKVIQWELYFCTKNLKQGKTHDKKAKQAI